MFQDLIYFILTIPFIVFFSHLIKKVTKDIIPSIFFGYVMVGFIVIALFEVAHEAATGTYGFFGKLRNPLYIFLNTTQYHFWLFWIFSGLIFIYFPFVFFLLVKYRKINLKIIFKNLKYIVFLIGVYYIGLTLEDFSWHIVHPTGILANFNPIDFFGFYQWINIGIWIPFPYLWQLLLGFFLTGVSIYKKGKFVTILSSRAIKFLRRI